MKKMLFVFAILTLTGCSTVDNDVDVVSETDGIEVSEEMGGEDARSEMEAMLEKHNLQLVLDGEYCVGSKATEIGGVEYPVYPTYGAEGDILGQMLTAVACGEERLAETGFDKEYTQGLRVVLLDTDENEDGLNVLNELGFVCEGNECEKNEPFMPIDLYPLLEDGMTAMFDYSDCVDCG